jgi:hypothetical protein
MKIECKDKDLMGKKVWEEEDDWNLWILFRKGRGNK